MSVELILKVITHWVYPALLVLFFFGLTIFIHEFGHFIVAKKRGMKVERFFIGFGPPIFSWKRGGVEYGVGWLPFGGYVALPQMSPMEAIEGKTEAKAAELPSISPATKTLVALAGPIMNVLMAFFLATIVWVFGLPTPVNPPVVGWVEPGSREEQLGIRAGDRIEKINDEVVTTWDKITFAVAVSEGPTVRALINHNGKEQEYLLETEMIPAFKLKTINLYPEGRPFARRVLPGTPAERADILAGDKFLSVEGVGISTEEQLRELIGKRPDMPTQVKVMRDGKIMTLNVTPEYVGGEEKAGRMGVELGDEIEYQLVKPGPTPLSQIKDVLSQMGRTMGAIINYKQTKVGLDSMSGPVGISVGWWMQIVHGGFLRGVWFAVVINIALATFNLLPIPVLDGGHITFAAIEAIFRRPVNPKLVYRLTTAFAVLLISFMLFVTFHDFKRFIPWPHKTSPQAPATNEPMPAAETNHP